MTTSPNQQDQGEIAGTLRRQSHEAQQITLGEMEGENGTHIPHRRPNFFVFTTSHSDHQPQSLFPRPTGRVSVLGKVALHPMLQITSRLRKLEQRKAKEKTHSQELSVSTAQPIEATTRDPQQASLVKTSVFSLSAWLETIIVIIGLMVTFAAHAINMFYYPPYEEDEGTYISAAWAVTHGQIAPYPYGYGHPPLAWIQLAAWVKLTGGFFIFGNALNSSRVLMLLYAVGCTLLVYLIARRLGANLSACLLAMVISSLSPLSITFQREVLLDNFATFWFLLSLYLVVAGKSRLFYTISAAICFGISLLSKEVLIVLFPVMIYVVLLYTGRFQRTFTLVAFIYMATAVGSTFVLMAVLKGELFPYSWHLPWDHHQHLSLIETYIGQVERGQGEGSIKQSWDTWINGDPLLMFLSIAATIFNLVVGWWNRRSLFLSLFAISFWALLLRGGVIFAFYLIPLIPLIALNAVLALNTLVRWIGQLIRFEWVGVVLIFALLVVIIPYEVQHDLSPYNLFTLRPSLVQTDALVWIRAHVQRRAMIAINPDLYVDLHEQGGEGVGDGTTYPYAHVYWNIALDPEVRDTLLKGNWDRIDYIVGGEEMLSNIESYGGGMDLLKTALEHSVLRVEFKGDDYEYIQIYQVIHIIPPPQV